MKVIKCEMCEGTKFIKEEDGYVCQSCGTKYSLEEAKKLMVETQVSSAVEVKGTVKIDDSSDLDNLYQLARSAKEQENYKSAQKYYEMILLKDPSSWEASFYSVYYDARQTTIANISNAINIVRNNLNNTITLIKEKFEQDIVRQHVEEVTIRTCSFMKDVAIAAMEFYDKNSGDSYNGVQDCANRIEAAISSLFYLFSLVHEIISIETKREVWGAMLVIHSVNYYNYTNPICDIKISDIRKLQYNNDPTAKETIYNGIVKKITNNQILPKKEYLAIEELELLGNYKESKKYLEILEKRKNERVAQQQGCYVATCVYGSYDCPEVWTLRRYRDNTLGSTWYGRIFIHTYYAISPTIVKWFGKSKWFKKVWKGKLDKMVKKLQDKGVESTSYQDKDWN